MEGFAGFHRVEKRRGQSCRVTPARPIIAGRFQVGEAREKIVFVSRVRYNPFEVEQGIGGVRDR